MYNLKSSHIGCSRCNFVSGESSIANCTPHVEIDKNTPTFLHFCQKHSGCVCASGKNGSTPDDLLSLLEIVVPNLFYDNNKINLSLNEATIPKFWLSKKYNIKK